MDHGGSVGPTRSCGICENWPRQSPASRNWSAGPARSRRRTADSGRRAGGCRRPHRKPCWPMRSIASKSSPASSPHPRTTRISSGAYASPSAAKVRQASPNADARRRTLLRVAERQSLGTSNVHVRGKDTANDKQRGSRAASRRPSRRRGETEGTCRPSSPSHPHTQTPPRHPARVDAWTPAAPTPPRPAAPQEPRAPHNMTRLTHRPAVPPLKSHGGLLPGLRPACTLATLPAATAQQLRLRAAKQSIPLAARHCETPRRARAQTEPDHAQGTAPANDSDLARRPSHPGGNSARRSAQHQPLQ